LIGLNTSKVSGEDADPSVKGKTKAEAIALQAAMKTAINGFRSSLAMRENADSLLTAPVLVQEALSDESGATVCFDSLLELDAPLCRT